MSKPNRVPRRFLLIFGVLTPLLTAILPLFNYWLDDTRAFSRTGDRYVSVTPNHRIASVRGVLELELPPRVILFGSSRVDEGFDTTDSPDWYKLTYPAAGIHDHIEALEALVQAGRLPAEAWVAIDPDINAYRTRGRTEEFTNTISFPSSAREWLHLCHKVLFKQVTAAELELARRKLAGEAELVPFGFYVNRPKATEIRLGPKHEPKLLNAPPFHPAEFQPVYYFEELIGELEQFVSICERNGVTCRLFISPRLYKTWIDQDFDQLETFKRLLVKVSSYHDFEGLHPLTRELKYWNDTSHYVGHVGDALRAKIEGTASSTPNFGAWVTPENVEQHLQDLRADLQRSLAELLQIDKHILVHPSLRSSFAPAVPAKFSTTGWSSKPEVTTDGAPAWLRLEGHKSLPAEQTLLRIEVETAQGARLLLQSPGSTSAPSWTRFYTRPLEPGTNIFFVPLTKDAARRGVRINLRDTSTPAHFAPLEYWGIPLPPD